MLRFVGYPYPQEDPGLAIIAVSPTLFPSYIWVYPPISINFVLGLGKPIIMNCNKFEYFLNAVHYCIWLYDKRNNSNFQNFLDVTLSPIPKYLFTRNYRKKFYERKKKEKELKENFLVGMSMIFAPIWFKCFYSGYSAFFSFILLGFTYKFFGALLFPIPIALGYIPAHKAVFSKDRYLEYFKLFEKEDEAWHKKWKRRTTLFIIGGITMYFLGIAVTTLF